MKIATLLMTSGLLVGSPSLAFSQEPSPSSSPSVAPMVTVSASIDYDGAYYKRQLYVVTDMERALTLWRDVIGLQPGDITTSGPNSYSREVFNIPAHAAMRFCTLSAGPNQVRTLALLEVKGVRLPRKTGIRTTGAVINANGRLDAIIAAARAKGLTIMGPRVLESATQGTGIEQGFLDWDGNVIVLYQFASSDVPSVR